MLFTITMARKLFYTIKILTLFITVILLSSCIESENSDFSVLTKIALRDAGNKLLLTNNDSISIILPVLELSSNKYQLSFSDTLSFEPNNLVSILHESIKSIQLPQEYSVEVIQCNNKEVAYSYQIRADKESTIIPCAGRHLPNSCYLIEVKFSDRINGFSIQKVILITILVLVIFGLILLVYYKTKEIIAKPINDSSEKLGSFYFYPKQHKLVKEATEIALSKKECELLALFVANPNQIIKRDELTKRVWEDNGVFVGRSLDTYVSKLRKKLKSDTTIKITNIHGVGYKLEID